MQRFLGIATLVAASLLGCRTSSSDDTELASGRGSRPVRGYTSNGQLVSRPPLTPNMACPQVLTPFAKQCEKAGGLISVADQCEELCSVKVTGNTVSGYTVNGEQVTRPVLEPNMSCPQVLTPFANQCERAGGQVTRADQCEELCSVKVSGNTVSGYTANGEKVTRPVLGPNMACPQVLTPFANQCEKAGGQITRADQCEELCSVKVSGKTVSGYASNGKKVTRPVLGPNMSCPQVLTPFGKQCERAGGQITRADQCEELCSVKVVGTAN